MPTAAKQPMQRALTLYSEGTRLAATLFRPASEMPPAGFPALLLCHGWGGVMAQLAPYAEAFAAAGFAVMTFDYWGWGESRRTHHRGAR